MNEPFSPQDSLALIRTMIDKTRFSLRENRFYFLLWGWVAFIAMLLQFFLKAVLHYRHHYMVWLATLPAVLVTIWYSKRHRQRGPRTYVGDAMSVLWLGIGCSFFVLSVIISRSETGWYGAFPFFILFYGLGTFISGKLLAFRPMVIGGIINWALAIGCAWAPYDYQILIGAAAIATSYLIPGYLLGRTKNDTR
ncbi:hypothetical protein [Flaviaesturariibacter amylovorans]|uniref:Uncharacterized protein n=1 Tax=Flaviaesturariibacter amylovorans TaxID=1084520 RepID=A0ABP8G6C9_9BACT